VTGLHLRVAIDGLSPLIVRTLVVPSKLSLADLNRVLLECFGWSGECLHVFDVRARSYSDCSMVDWAETSINVTLESLSLRRGERFSWCYDFIAGWRVTCLVEALGVDDADEVVCVDGRRAGPLGWIRGPAGFYRWEDSFSILDMVEALGDFINIDDRPSDDGHQEEDDDRADREVEALHRLRVVSRWMVRDGFDKAVLNGRLSMLEVPSCVSLFRSG